MMRLAGLFRQDAYFCDKNINYPDKQLGAVISENKYQIYFFYLFHWQSICNQDIMEKEIFPIVSCLDQIQLIMLCEEINTLSEIKSATCSHYM